MRAGCAKPWADWLKSSCRASRRRSRASCWPSSRIATRRLKHARRAHCALFGRLLAVQEVAQAARVSRPCGLALASAMTLAGSSSAARQDAQAWPTAPLRPMSCRQGSCRPDLLRAARSQADACRTRPRSWPKPSASACAPFSACGEAHRLEAARAFAPYKMLPDDPEVRREGRGHRSAP